MELEELLGMCCVCGKIRIDNEKNKWISETENPFLYNSLIKKYEGKITHGYCPEDYAKVMKEINNK